MNLIENTVTSCIHLLILKRHDRTLAGIGSAVIIRYKDRYFLCTVHHNIRNPATMACIATGRTNGENSETIEIGDFSYVEKFSLPDPTSQSLTEILEGEQPSDTLDIAFREISLLDNIVQQRRVIPTPDGDFEVPAGGKSYVIADDDFDFDTNSAYSFYGRVRPAIIDGKFLDFEENLITGINLIEVQDLFLKFDLGRSIVDHSNFRGCSGAPIFDFEGRFVGLVSGGSRDVTLPYIYGFRADKLKEFIELTYFREFPTQPPIE